MPLEPGYTIVNSGGGGGETEVRKTVIFNNSDSDITLFAVTGSVRLKLYSVCAVNLVSAGGCEIGLKAGVKEFIPMTDCTILAAGEIWNDITPTNNVEKFYDAVFEYMITDDVDIVLDIEAAKQVDSGRLEFYLEYTALSSGGAVVAV
jgi:hypothetical protein